MPPGFFVLLGAGYVGHLLSRSVRLPPMRHHMTVPTAATAGKDAAEDHLAAIEQLYEEAMAHIAEFVEASSPPPPADVDTAADAVVPVNAKPSPAQQIAAA